MKSAKELAAIAADIAEKLDDLDPDEAARVLLAVGPLRKTPNMAQPEQPPLDIRDLHPMPRGTRIA